MSIFAQVWLWSLVAFVLGVLLTWVLLVRPAQTRVRELERKLVASRSEPVPARQEYADYDDAQADYGYVAAPDAAQPYHGDDAVFDDFAEFDDGEQAEPEQRHEPDYPAAGPFEPAGTEQTEYLPQVQGRDEAEWNSQANGSDISSALNPAASEPAEVDVADPQPSRGLFQPATPSSTDLGYEQPVESALPEPALDDGGPSTETLPKRQPKESPRGGFDPPQPVQPSMRTVTRREPAAGDTAHSGSLFEPSGAGEATGGQDLAPEPAPMADGESTKVGPFGPGSAMPLPGGAKPSEEFAIKASVTTLRYCPQDSPKFADMVAEVWFRSPEDAERVGFRAIS